MASRLKRLPWDDEGADPLDRVGADPAPVPPSVAPPPAPVPAGRATPARRGTTRSKVKLSADVRADVVEELRDIVAARLGEGVTLNALVETLLVEGLRRQRDTHFGGARPPHRRRDVLPPGPRIR